MWQWPLTVRVYGWGSFTHRRLCMAIRISNGGSRSLGEIHAFGIEGTGSYGAGVARYLTRRGHTVVEVNRPDRSTRYRKGKSDPTDAEMAARSVLAGVAEATPKSGEGEVEMIRMLKSAKGLGRQGSHPGPSTR